MRSRFETRFQSWWPGTARSRENANIIRDAEVVDAIVQKRLGLTFVEAVKYVGEKAGIEVREVREPLFGAPALGDILVGRNPSAVCQRFVDDLDETAVRSLDEADFFLSDVAQDQFVVFVFVTDDRSDFLPKQVQRAGVSPDLWPLCG